MTKLKLGPLIEDKPVKVVVELPGRCTAILPPMPKCWLAKPASPLPILSG